MQAHQDGMGGWSQYNRDFLLSWSGSVPETKTMIPSLAFRRTLVMILIFQLK